MLTGSGHGAYEYVFDTIVLPALRRFQPDLVLVSSGYDASFRDPLANMVHSNHISTSIILQNSRFQMIIASA